MAVHQWRGAPREWRRPARRSGDSLRPLPREGGENDDEAHGAGARNQRHHRTQPAQVPGLSEGLAGVRWSQLFPKVAESFGIACVEPQTFSLSEVIQDKAEVWERMVRKYGLVQHSLKDLATWPFGDFIFNVNRLKARKLIPA